MRNRDDDILQSLYEAHADVYGFSCYIWNIEKMLLLSENLHNLLPDAKILFGGPEVSFDTERFDQSAADCILQGEGEDAIVSVCEMIRDGIALPRVFSKPASAVMRDEGILYQPDDCPDGEMLYYESSRGCPYRCSYCLSSVNEKLRMKSVQQTLDDLLAFEKLPQRIKIIKFVDRTFNADVNRANEIWRALLSDRYTKNYHFEVCASLLNEESFAIFEQMPKGKIQLEFGLQSTNERTLQEVSRHIRPDAVIASVRRIFEMGNIHVHLDLIAGLPYEGYERFAKSFDDAYGSCNQLQLGFLKLLHGTALRNDAEKYGYVFLSQAPYTVLQSKWITRDELYKLEQIADLLDRYANSSSFIHSLEIIFPYVSSPFAFYEGLLDSITRADGRNIRQISQLDAFRLLYRYAKNFLPPDRLPDLQEAMKTDYLLKETRQMPASVFF